MNQNAKNPNPPIPMPDRRPPQQQQQPIPGAGGLTGAGLMGLVGPVLESLKGQGGGGGSVATDNLAVAAVEEMRHLRVDVTFWRDRSVAQEERISELQAEIQELKLHMQKGDDNDSGD